MMKQEAGFTLIELMVTLAIAVIGLGIGLPMLRSTLDRTRASGTYHLLTASLMSARATAVARRHSVTMCPSFDGKRCTDESVWEGGWIIFVDPARQGQPGNAAAILRRVDPLGGSIGVRSTRGRVKVSYLKSGRAPGSNLTFSICSRDTRLLGKVVVNNSGRARSERTIGDAACPSVN